MIEWLNSNPYVFGIITFVLMQIDWFLTLSQEKKERNIISSITKVIRLIQSKEVLLFKIVLQK